MTALKETVDLLGRFVAFPTISVDSNLDLIDFVAERLEHVGARIYTEKDSTGQKANLFATLGPERDGGIVLSGHTDVVPVEGQDWSTDPFKMVERDGKLLGRGTCDMKGFIAASIALAPEFADLDLRRPLHFCFTYDEETGCFGAQQLVKSLKAQGIRPGIAIIGEPTDMRVIEGHKGGCEYTTHFHGLEGHASMPHQGVNAVEYAVRYISKLMALGEEMRSRAEKDSPFDPPWTTVQVGKIEGGIARNIIPKDCSVEWEVRPVKMVHAHEITAALDAYSAQELLPEMKAVFPDADIVRETICEIAGLEVVPESEAIKLVQELTGRSDTGVVSFGTEAGLFQDFGMSTVLCGPGSIEQAHRPDEHVKISELESCLNMLGRLKEKLV